MESKNPLTEEEIILGLGGYPPPPVNLTPKKKHDMCRRKRKLLRLKVRHYAAHFIGLNEYLDLFPGANLTGKLV